MHASRREMVAPSDSLEATDRLAAALAAQLRPGDVLCLRGELGAGKTTFVAAVARALGVRQDVVSPTFTLENRYAATGAIATIAHYDLYRPGEDARRDLVPMMLEARDEGCLVAVEWPEPAVEWLEPYLDVHFLRRAAAREIRLADVPVGWPRWSALVAAWSACGGVEEVPA